MKSIVVYSARKALINIAKVFPFVLCFIVGIEYAETLFSSVLSHYCMYGSIVIPFTPLSFNVACFWEYDYMGVVIMLVLSYSLETCCWNKYANYYLFGNLVEKHSFTMPLEIYAINIICVLNLILIIWILIHSFIILLNILK